MDKRVVIIVYYGRSINRFRRFWDFSLFICSLAEYQKRKEVACKLVSRRIKREQINSISKQYEECNGKQESKVFFKVSTSHKA